MLAGVSLDSPVDHYDLSDHQSLDYTVIDLDDVEVNGVTYTARQVDMTHSDGDTVSSWFAKGIGMVRMEGGYQLSSFSAR